MALSFVSIHIISLLLSSGFVQSQTIHLVTVGTSGSFYDPPTVSAQKGDIVRFLFTSSDHTVTQSTYETPCIPLPGGFNSGLIGPAINTSASLLSWDIIVSDDTQPIWYFCEGTSPQSHCAAGMAGVINPPSLALWDNFISAAKAVSGTPSPTPGLVLTGVGAYATNAPTPVLSLTATPSSDVSAISSLSVMFATSTLSPTISSSHSSSRNSIGPIVGGVVGGVAAVAIIMILAILLYRAKRTTRRNEPANPETTPMQQKDHQPALYSPPLAPNRAQQDYLLQSPYAQSDPYHSQWLASPNLSPNVVMQQPLHRQLPRPPVKYNPLLPQPSIRDIAQEVVEILKHEGQPLAGTGSRPDAVVSAVPGPETAGRSSIEYTEDPVYRASTPVTASFPPQYEA